MGIFRAKALLNFALSLVLKGDKKWTFHLSSFEIAHYDQKWYPDFFGVRLKQKTVCKYLICRIS